MSTSYGSGEKGGTPIVIMQTFREYLDQKTLKALPRVAEIYNVVYKDRKRLFDYDPFKLDYLRETGFLVMRFRSYDIMGEIKHCTGLSDDQVNEHIDASFNESGTLYATRNTQSFTEVIEYENGTHETKRTIEFISFYRYYKKFTETAPL